MASHTYDDNGNLAFDGQFHYYYDCENRLTDINDVNDAPVTSYAYDYRGRRITKIVYDSPNVTTQYCYDGDQIIAEYDGSGTLLRKFIYGPGIDEPIGLVEVADNNAVYYYHFDGLGSVVALSDVNSVLVERYTYDVFGRPTIRDANSVVIDESAFDNPYLFTARAYEAESGLYYYRARYYDYYTGRFLQPDPIGYADGLSLYGYVGNNPVGYADPWGLCKNESRLERLGSSIIGWEIGFGETITNSVNGLIDLALHPWKASLPYYIAFGPEIVEQQIAAIQRFWADASSGDAERIGRAMGSISGIAFTTAATIEIGYGIGQVRSAPSAGTGASNLDDLSRAAAQMDRNHLTKAGRSLQKHANRPGSTYETTATRASEYNAAGQNIVDDVLTAPGSRVVRNPVGGVDVIAADGRAVRFNAEGGFVGFREP